MLVKELGIFRAPFARRALAEACNRRPAKDGGARGTDPRYDDPQIVITDLDSDTGSKSQEFLEVVCCHCTQTLSYQRSTR